jgi:hypothetical protein
MWLMQEHILVSLDPRTVTGLEVLAKIINPENFEYIRVPPDSFTKYNI